MVKLTFSLDEATVNRLRRSAARLRKPQSQVVREAIHDYSVRVGKLSEEERLHLLNVFDSMVPAIPRRSLREVKQEVTAIRRARRAGGRQHPANRPR